jgi:hypothetical protein
MRPAVVQPGRRAGLGVGKAALARGVELVLHDSEEQPECDADAQAKGGVVPRRPALERSGRVRASELRTMVDDFVAWESEQLHEGRKAPRRAGKPGGAGAGGSPLGQLLPSAVRKCRSLARLSLRR